jgi:ribosomal protein L11 methylase PrmA
LACSGAGPTKRKTQTMSESRSTASFRDPSGFIFTRQGSLYRQVNRIYQENYEALMTSGLYDRLVLKGWLVAHEEVSEAPYQVETAFKVVQPEVIPFISYPYEWSFSQLKAAALRTLAVQKLALEHGMSLKDASAFNIQFTGWRPVLIDTLSFERYAEGKPWTAYRQFCQHFLAPLALMAYRDVRTSRLLWGYIDGLPLDLASRLLPRRSKFNFGLATHIHLHAASQQRYSGQAVDPAKAHGRMGKTALLGLVDSLASTVRKLTWKPAGTEWAGYYEQTNYPDQSMQHKVETVQRFIEQVQPELAWDLGANTGRFSRLASQTGCFTVSFDIDPAAVELNYQSCREGKEENLLPLVLDLTNPSPAIGWGNQERLSLMQRGPADMILALALIHHLAISNNVPLAQLAEFFTTVTRWLAIEFVPKSDSQVQRLLATRQDIFPDYTAEGFLRAFTPHFQLHQSAPINGSDRTLYLFERLK